MTDSALAPYRDLRSGRSTTARTEFIVEGETAVRRLLESRLGFTVASVLTTPSHHERLVDLLDDRAEVHVRSAAELREIVGFDFHRGCLLHGRVDGGFDRDGLSALPAHPKVIAAQGLSDPRNVGALVRNAMGFGLDLVLCDRRGANPFSRQAIRAAMGHCFNVPIWVCELGPALDALTEAKPQMQLWAATPGPKSQALGSVDPPASLCLLVGNEGRGLSPALLERADRRVAIPMSPGADSLNVAAATAIFLYVLCRPDRRLRSAKL